jgi:hypothetical protein
MSNAEIRKVLIGKLNQEQRGFGFLQVVGQFENRPANR